MPISGQRAEARSRLKPAPQLSFVLPAFFLLLAGCEFGTVNQGQVIDYQRGQGRVTLIADSNYKDPAHPKFDILPPVTIRTPVNPKEMGPEPEAGKLLRLDWRNRRLTIFNSATQAIETFEYSEVGQASWPAKCGTVDRAKKTITVCSSADRRAVAISVAESYLALPDDTWKTGDEIRYYYKDVTQALRLMNVTRTNLN